MSGVLCVETATDACSLALLSQGRMTDCHEIIPRLHNVLLFGMLQTLLPDGDLENRGISAIAYGCGPGSFTGLRIAAGFAQGLAFSSQLPAIPISTLATMAQTALADGLCQEGDRVLVLLDARINEVYYAVYDFQNGFPRLLESPKVCSPAALSLPEKQSVVAIGSGCRYHNDFSDELKASISEAHSALLPRARDMMPLAIQALESGNIQSARDIAPVYVQEEISWKKLSEQGRAH